MSKYIHTKHETTVQLTMGFFGAPTTSLAELEAFSTELRNQGCEDGSGIYYFVDEPEGLGFTTRGLRVVINNSEAKQ